MGHEFCQGVNYATGSYQGLAYYENTPMQQGDCFLYIRAGYQGAPSGFPSTCALPEADAACTGESCARTNAPITSLQPSVPQVTPPLTCDVLEGTIVAMGSWEPVSSSNQPQTVYSTSGTTTLHTVSSSSSSSSSVSVGLSVTYSMVTVGLTIDHDQSQSASHETNFSTTSTSTYLYDMPAGTVWQWKALASGAYSSVMADTNSMRRTTSLSEPPCCFPGFEKDITDPHNGGCQPGMNLCALEKSQDALDVLTTTAKLVNSWAQTGSGTCPVGPEVAADHMACQGIESAQTCQAICDEVEFCSAVAFAPLPVVAPEYTCQRNLALWNSDATCLLGLLSGDSVLHDCDNRLNGEAALPGYQVMSCNTTQYKDCVAHRGAEPCTGDGAYPGQNLQGLPHGSAYGECWCQEGYCVNETTLQCALPGGAYQAHTMYDVDNCYLYKDPNWASKINALPDAFQTCGWANQESPAHSRRLMGSQHALRAPTSPFLDKTSFAPLATNNQTTCYKADLCEPITKEANWVPISTTGGAGAVSTAVSFDVGTLSSMGTVNRLENYAYNSFSLGLGFSFGVVGVGLDVSTTSSHKVVAMNLAAIYAEETTTYQDTFAGSGVVWQFQFNTAAPCGNSTIKGRNLRITPSMAEPPCCLPGFEIDINAPHGACKPDANGDRWTLQTPSCLEFSTGQ